MRISRLFWTCIALASLVLPCRTLAVQVIASVRHGEGHAAITFTDDGNVFWGSFGSDPGTWAEAGTVPMRKPIAAVTQFDTGGGVLIITTDGSVYWGSFAGLPGTWTELTPFPLPGELGALSWLGTGHTVLGITRDGRAFRGWFGGVPGTWTEVASVPLATVSIQEKSWSGVKGDFRK